MALNDLQFDDLSPAGLWAALDSDTQRQAARSMYRDRDNRREADMAVAQTLRFRPQAITGMPVERRIGYLLKAVRIDDGLASTLLIALHLDERSELLSTFLGELGIPNDGGVIDPDHELEPLDAERLGGPVAKLYEQFDSAQVDLYLACLIAMDPDSWNSLAGILEKRLG